MTWRRHWLKTRCEGTGSRDGVKNTRSLPLGVRDGHDAIMFDPNGTDRIFFWHACGNVFAPTPAEKETIQRRCWITSEAEAAGRRQSAGAWRLDAFDALAPGDISPRSGPQPENGDTVTHKVRTCTEVVGEGGRKCILQRASSSTARLLVAPVVNRHTHILHMFVATEILHVPARKHGDCKLVRNILDYMMLCNRRIAGGLAASSNEAQPWCVGRGR